LLEKYPLNPLTLEEKEKLTETSEFRQRADNILKGLLNLVEKKRN
jgi:hypothetical protein